MAGYTERKKKELRDSKEQTGEEEILKMKDIGYTDKHGKYSHDIRVPVKGSYTDKSNISNVRYKASVKTSHPKHTESDIHKFFDSLISEIRADYRETFGKEYTGPGEPSKHTKEKLQPTGGHQILRPGQNVKYEGSIMQPHGHGQEHAKLIEDWVEAARAVKSGKHKKDNLKRETYSVILLLIGTYLMSTYIPKDGITGNYILNSGTSLFTLLFMIVVLIVALILIKNTFFKKEVVKPIRKKSRTKRKAKSKRRK
ncbi:MAG: hypothetical protein KJ697_00980 [Nanoarchaeota archaeon]|nr:hypothetical protein [Nanoarchaeota archaeon]MBU4124360.1 hypothetical protein [Nanoarchaeota archaeon]